MYTGDQLSMSRCMGVSAQHLDCQLCMQHPYPAAALTNADGQQVPGPNRSEHNSPCGRCIRHHCLTGLVSNPGERRATATQAATRFGVRWLCATAVARLC